MINLYFSEDVYYNPLTKPFENLKVERFLDGTPKIQFKVIKDKNYTLLWKYDSLEELFIIYSICRKIKIESPASEITLQIPYFPNARMDRTKTLDDTFTLKFMCDIINSLETKKVEVFDPHSDVLPALLENCVIKNLDDTVLQLINGTLGYPCFADVIFFPDTGAKTKYTRGILSKLKDVAFGVKNRDWKTGQLLELEVFGADVKDKKVLIIDDICSKGDTILRAANKLKELGATDVNVFVSHCENTVIDSDLIKSNIIKNIYTTDSVFRKENEKIKIIPIESCLWTEE